MWAALLSGGLTLALASVVEDPSEAFCSDEFGCSTNFLQVGHQAQRRSGGVPNEAPWPTMRGQRPEQFGTTKEVFGRLTKPAWVWQHPKGQYHTLLSGGTVIDENKNMYQQTAQGVLKLNENGDVLWTFETPGRSNNQPSLMGSTLVGSTTTGNAWGVDTATGEALWITKLADDAGGDCGYPAGHQGIFVVGAKAGKTKQVGGNLRIFGLNATDGGKIWEYDLDVPSWNFAPLFPDDTSVTFMDFTGGVFRLNLQTGAETWKNIPTDSLDSFSDGGATLGPNKMMYTCSNPGSGTGSEGQTGIVRAFDLSDGKKVWEKTTESPCNSYPAVGKIRGSDKLAMVVTPGSFMGQPSLHGYVLALDASNGEEMWRFNTAPYTGILNQAKGDAEGVKIRVADGIQAICLPAHWSSANIDGSGTVYTGRADGSIYVVYGPKSAVSEVAPGMIVDNKTDVVGEKIPIGSASLHGAFAFAKNLVAYATCDSLYVFKPNAA